MGIRRRNDRPAWRSLAVRDPFGIQLPLGQGHALLLVLSICVDEPAPLR